MGHYASEMSDTWNDSIERGAREDELISALKDKPLSEFKAADIAALCKLFKPYRGTDFLNDSEIRALKKYI
jgi:hypothetical protein